ncbi:Trk system potassium transporter TrkA [Fusobacterium perfoetens]|uniref:Trk system potassium transporter TrkA n=1 Tax=Fusobacterium perfoetens TaxID=852 RepID=UPI001F2C1CFC|nr:Trk system potassium transporter TrkA [Fusobacterium perfoetens]MCF2625985.1 Trk system potassium transporter TrkA [Fusobacterium perfoetens]
MKIVIVGAGKIGEILCRDLSTEGNDITLIEQEAKILDRVLSVSDIMGIVGNGANREVLADAGVHSADIFIAVTTNDEINLISSVMAKKMGAKYTIARVRNPEYSEQMQFMKESLGIDIMLNPEAEAADFIRKNLEYPNALNVDSFAKNKVNLVEILVEENSYLDGLKLVDFKRNHFRNLLVCIVQRGPEVYVPTGNFVLKADDRIYVTGAHADLGEFYKSLGHSGERIKSVFIVGGGRITHYLADILLKKKMKLKIVELKEERAKELSETFENAEIINGNGIDLDLLEEENFSSYDACVSLTGIDEENIIISMFADKIGIKKTITKINSTSLLNVLDFVGLQSILTPKKIIADYIVKIVRSFAGAQGENNIQNLYRLADNRVEAIEFSVGEYSRVAGIPLKDLHIKENVLIPYIIREGKLIMPGGLDVIKPYDTVIIITTQQYLDDIDQIINFDFFNKEI